MQQMPYMSVPWPGSPPSRPGRRVAQLHSTSRATHDPHWPPRRAELPAGPQHRSCLGGTSKTITDHYPILGQLQDPCHPWRAFPEGSLNRCRRPTVPQQPGRLRKYTPQGIAPDLSSRHSCNGANRQSAPRLPGQRSLLQKRGSRQFVAGVRHTAVIARACCQYRLRSGRQVCNSCFNTGTRLQNCKSFIAPFDNSTRVPGAQPWNVGHVQVQIHEMLAATQHCSTTTVRQNRQLRDRALVHPTTRMLVSRA